jgi:hypothetical protein
LNQIGSGAEHLILLRLLLCEQRGREEQGKDKKRQKSDAGPHESYLEIRF